MMAQRKGLTLIEVAIALSVAAIVVVLARSIVEVLGENARRVSATAARREANANAERALRTIVATVILADGDSGAFVGTQRFAAFRSWCLDPGGWRERCSVTLLIDTTSETRRLVYQTGKRDPVVVRSGFASASLRYLKSAEGDGTWMTVWAQAGTPPLALGVVVDRDTTILRIGQSS